MKKIYLITSLLFVFCAKSFSQVSLVQFSTGFTSPVDIKNAGDSRLFVVEQAGRIYIVDTTGVRHPVPFLNIQSRVLSGSERGLLGLAFPPDFATSGYFYVDYSSLTNGNTRISRFSVSPTNPDSALASSEQILLTIYQPYSNHNGGNVMFGPDGYLYISMGDGGSAGDPQNRAQNKDSLLGKILRIDVSSPAYTNPPDNPFVGVAGRDEIWNWGMRNPWRCSFDSWTGDLWMGDVGQDQWEEVDYQPRSIHGGNYGWRCYEGNHAYNTAGCGPIGNYIGATYEYAHSGSAAVVGGYVYRGAEYADMFGKYFFTDEYTTTYGFRTLTPNGSGGFTAANLGALGRGTVVTFGEDEWHEVYCAEYLTGKIFKFQSTACQPVAFISNNDTLYVCDTIHPYMLHTPGGKGFHYQWYKDGSLTGPDNDTLMITQPGSYHVEVTNRSSCLVISSAVQVIYSGIPSVTFTGLSTSYCVNHQPSNLVGNPAGGTFTGPGLSGTGNSVFNPALAAGDDTITYHYTVPVTGCVTTSSMATHVDLCIGINETNNIYSLSLYPNPNNGEFNLGFYLATNEVLNTEVTDVLGKVVYNENIMLPSGLHSIPMNLKTLSKGIYNLKISETGGRAVVRFIIQ